MGASSSYLRRSPALKCPRSKGDRLDHFHAHRYIIGTALDHLWYYCNFLYRVLYQFIGTSKQIIFDPYVSCLRGQILTRWQERAAWTKFASWWLIARASCGNLY